ncbi:MAG: hypothetical protein JXB18_15165, partial [Sedimentisphaerales bacterium]|nr:hypothetical protein [Sedimentisphaerales bacterium]
MKKTVAVGLVMVIVLVAACSVNQGMSAEGKTPVRPLRVGVYDSRCITVAYVHSEFSKNEIQKLFDIVHKAEKDGDTKKAQSSRQIAEYMQKKRHAQGFSTASVQDLLEPVKKHLHQVAQTAGVDMIVSQWQIDYRVEGAEVVDVTDAIVVLYKPDEKALKTIESLKNVKP